MKKIPDNAKVVFKGILFDVYQWEQKMFDGSFETFEAIKRRNGVSIIAVVGNTIILNKEEQPAREPFYTLPAGMMEENSSPLENAKRELLEETGHESCDWEEWFISDPIQSSKIECNNYFFIARDCQKMSDQKLDSGEKIENIFLTFDEFLELRKNPQLRNKDLFPALDKALGSEEEKEKLKTLLFGTK